MKHANCRAQKACLASVLCLLLALETPAFAAHPLQTEDTGTQGVGNAEFENGFSRSRTGGASVFEYQPQLSYGVTPDLDLILQPSWLSSRPANGDVVHGWGDTNLDGKWRYYGAAPWSLAVRAGLGLASNQRGLGLPHGQVSAHALAVATYDAAPFTIHGNLGYTRNPAQLGQRQDLEHASVAIMWATNERLILTSEASVDTSTDAGSSAWAGTWLAGLVYTLRPGLDLDAGYQATVRSPVSTRSWLFGITYRFAP